MEVMSASMSRMCQVVHDAGLRLDTEECLQVVLEAARERGLLDNIFISLFDEALVGFLDKFTIIKKLVDDLDVRLQPSTQALPRLPPSPASMVTTSSMH